MSGTITHEWQGTTLVITSDSGTSSCDLKGEQGDIGVRGCQGEPGIFIYEELTEEQKALLKGDPAPTLYEHTYTYSLYLFGYENKICLNFLSKDSEAKTTWQALYDYLNNNGYTMDAYKAANGCMYAVEDDLVKLSTIWGVGVDNTSGSNGIRFLGVLSTRASGYTFLSESKLTAVAYSVTEVK